MNWSDIPSLSALRAFEAAARTGSLSNAARELNVTHAAIAQHLRGLEAHFGRAVMKRSGRGMALTELGAQLIGPVQDGFAQIAHGVLSATTTEEARPVNLSVTPAFAETWLMPRLGKFWQAHPDIPLSIQPSFALVDFARDDVDMAIRFGRGHWPGHDVTYLTDANYVIVAAPELAETLPMCDIPGLAGQSFIFEPGYPEARRWMESQGLVIPDDDIRPLPTFSMVLSAVRAGAGISILSAPIVARDLEQGTLVSVCASDEDEIGYWILTRKAAVSPRLRTLKKWLLSVV